jgi:hypothetical protein
VRCLGGGELCAVCRVDFCGLDDHGSGNVLDFMHGVVGGQGDGSGRDGFQTDSASFANFCFLLIVVFVVGRLGSGGGMFAPTSDQRTQSQETCGSGSSADFSNTKNSNRVCHCPELASGAAESGDETKARHRHDTADTSQHQDKACRDLGLMIHLHSTKGKNGNDSENPVGECVDDAVGVLKTLHGFPSQTHGMIVSVVKVHGIAAAEDCDEEEGEAKDCVDGDGHLHGEALPSLEQNAVEGECERSLEEHVCQSVEGELEGLVLIIVRDEHFER